MRIKLTFGSSADPAFPFEKREYAHMLYDEEPDRVCASPRLDMHADTLEINSFKMMVVHVKPYVCSFS